MKPLLAILLCLLLPAAEARAPLLRTAADINALSDAEFAAKVPFSVEGVVTYVDGTVAPGCNPIIGLKDQTGEIVLHSPRGRPVPTAGDVVRAAGLTAFDSYFQPHASYTNLVVVGHTAPPEPIRLPLAELLRGDHRNRFVETSGTVADAFHDEIDSRYNHLLLKRGADVMPVSFPCPGIEEAALQSLIGAEVRVTGICSTMSGAGERDPCRTCSTLS